jgi:hypothetical protein
VIVTASCELVPLLPPVEPLLPPAPAAPPAATPPLPPVASPLPPLAPLLALPPLFGFDASSSSVLQATTNAINKPIETTERCMCARATHDPRQAHKHARSRARGSAIRSRGSGRSWAGDRRFGDDQIPGSFSGEGLLGSTTSLRGTSRCMTKFGMERSGDGPALRMTS